MHSTYQFKPRFQSVLKPAVKVLHHYHITPNSITVFSIVMSGIFSAWMALMPNKPCPWLILPLALFIRMALNAIDGMLAREFSMKSNLGLILNELGDVVADVFFFFPISLIAGVFWEPILIACVLISLAEMAGILGICMGKTRRYDGPMGKSDRAVFLGCLGLLFGLGIIHSSGINIAIIVILPFLLLTIFNRIKATLAQAQNAN